MANSLNPPQEPNWWSRNWKWFVPVAIFTFVVRVEQTKQRINLLQEKKG